MGKDKQKTPAIVSENLPEDVNKVLEELTEDQRRVLMGTMFAMEQRMYSGPLPPADEIAAYEQTCKGAANRIISMAEQSLSNRITNEQFIIREDAKQVSRGQILGFLLAIFFGGIAFALGLQGHDVLAGIIAGSDIVALAVIFVLNKVPVSGKGNDNAEMRIQDETE
ncbi:MAG: DUF2335 domain-containing protein [Prevotella sp.]|nr:DUF2335 domain-containing protein [Prevotella sp.]